ncbi:MAG: hypothetical protein [Podoviridae sp. ctdb7]|nr:MAG: hypothetical protein [Podoviridae sp. ctdb7]
MKRLSVPADALPAQLPLFRAWPAVNHSPIGKCQYHMEAIVVLLVRNPGARQPTIKALHGLCFHALFVALRIRLAAFATTIPAATRVANTVAYGLAAA